MPILDAATQSEIRARVMQALSERMTQAQAARRGALRCQPLVDRQWANSVRQGGPSALAAKRECR